MPGTSECHPVVFEGQLCQQMVPECLVLQSDPPV